VPKSPTPARASRAGSGARSPRPRNREQTIKDILDAAEALLDSKGPDGFGLAELGREAGISFGLIHHYFGGKEGLLRAVLQRTLREMGREIRRIQDAGHFWDPDAPAVRVVFDTFARKPGLARLLAWGLLTGLLTVEECSHEPDRAALDAMIDKFREGMPGATRTDAAATTTLLMSAVLGFNLLRPFLAQTSGWTAKTDTVLRDQLVRAMGALARPRGPSSS